MRFSIFYKMGPDGFLYGYSLAVIAIELPPLTPANAIMVQQN